MNCRRFEDGLEEYLDGTLPPGDRAAADAHLAGCAVCQEALQRNRQTSQILSRSFQQATASLRLRPQLQQRVRQELAADSAAEAHWPIRVWNVVRFLWPWPAIAGGLVIAASLAWQGFHSAPAPVPTGRAAEPYPPVSIHVAYYVPTHSFQREGPFVRDSLVYHPVVVNGGLGSELTSKPRSSK